MVAETFIPNVDKKPFINHIDGTRNNNEICNLEWCTAKENTQHAIKILSFPHGSRNGFTIITEQKAIEIKILLKENKLTVKQIAENCKTTIGIVRNIKIENTWKWIKI